MKAKYNKGSKIYEFHQLDEIQSLYGKNLVNVNSCSKIIESLFEGNKECGECVRCVVKKFTKKALALQDKGGKDELEQKVITFQRVTPGMCLAYSYHWLINQADIDSYKGEEDVFNKISIEHIVEMTVAYRVFLNDMKKKAINEKMTNEKIVEWAMNFLKERPCDCKISEKYEFKFPLKEKETTISQIKGEDAPMQLISIYVPKGKENKITNNYSISHAMALFRVKVEDGPKWRFFDPNFGVYSYKKIDDLFKDIADTYLQERTEECEVYMTRMVISPTSKKEF